MRRWIASAAVGAGAFLVRTGVAVGGNAPASRRRLATLGTAALGQARADLLCSAGHPGVLTAESISLVARNLGRPAIPIPRATEMVSALAGTWPFAVASNSPSQAMCNRGPRGDETQPRRRVYHLPQARSPQGSRSARSDACAVRVRLPSRCADEVGNVLAVLPFFTWLIQGALGPAAFGLPVNWAAEKLADQAVHWFKWLRRTDDLSNLVKAATGTSVEITRDEFDRMRDLLKDQQTWVDLGRCTVDELAQKIATQLSAHDGRDSLATAMAIARGLLEFAVVKLEPEIFQQVVLTRLRRMQESQDDRDRALDTALLDLHAGLLGGFTGVMEELQLVLARLPPGPAHQAEVMVYLGTLIDWLGTDPWVYRSYDGPVLTGSAIERKLRVITQDGQDLDADQLAERCQRLVILGGPGSGKTWLAKRAARRCAERARQVLMEGAKLDEIELPLYTTCSLLFGAGGNFREAAVSSALDQMPDLGVSRISAALREFFTDRAAPTLLVIDSIDEAHGHDDLLSRANRLPWRIVLTSRPRSWRHQLELSAGDPSHQIGELQPLCYPGDVQPFIDQWFAGQPERGADLAAQIARHPGLRQAATVPLILAFFCIIEAWGPLPEFRRDLYAKVLGKMLDGYWHDAGDSPLDEQAKQACLLTLREWAWAGAASHPVSGVGMWADEIEARPVRLSADEASALDHIAVPIRRPGDDTGRARRFIHRSVREHLVAEHVASLPVDQAVEALLPHLWYDRDWEYAAPAAVVMHPERDRLLRDLIGQAARSAQVCGALSIADAGWEFWEFLARAAAESSQDDWAPDIAGAIGQARVILADLGRVDDLGRAAHWETSSGEARRKLLQQLAGDADSRTAAKRMGRLIQLDATAQDKQQAREILLRLLAEGTGSWTSSELVAWVVHLAATTEDKQQARAELLGQLTHQDDRLLAAQLAGELARLDPPPPDQQQAREALLELLAHPRNGPVAAELANALARLDPSPQDRQQARRAIADFLAELSAPENQDTVTRPDQPATDMWQPSDQPTRFFARTSMADTLDALVPLAVTEKDKEETRQILLGFLAGQTDSFISVSLAEVLAGLDLTPADKRQALDQLLQSLTRPTHGSAPIQVCDGILKLDPTPEDQGRARAALIGWLTDRGDNPGVITQLASMVARLNPTADEKRIVRGALLKLPGTQADSYDVPDLVGWVIQFGPTPDEERYALDTLLGFLARTADGSLAAELADVVAKLKPTPQEKQQARNKLLELLTGKTGGWLAGQLARGLAQLDPAPADKRQAREVLLGLLISGHAHMEILDAMPQLDPVVDDLRDWNRWPILPTSELLTAARRNSPLGDWLNALSALPLDLQLTSTEPPGLTSAPSLRHAGTRGRDAKYLGRFCR